MEWKEKSTDLRRLRADGQEKEWCSFSKEDLKMISFSLFCQNLPLSFEFNGYSYVVQRHEKHFAADSSHNVEEHVVFN